jgi:hypothetical protein
MQGELSANSPANPPFHFLVHSVPLLVAGEILHMGRSKLYDLLGEGKLQAVKDGTRVMVTVESIKQYQDSLPPATFARPKPPRLERISTGSTPSSAPSECRAAISACPRRRGDWIG